MLLIIVYKHKYIKMKSYLNIITILYFLCGCIGNTNRKDFEKIENFLNIGNFDSATVALNTIDTVNLDNKSKAYFTLLRTQCLYSCGANVDTTNINLCINTLKGSSKKELLARSYHYKAISIKDTDVKNALYYELQAEKLLSDDAKLDRKSAITYQKIAEFLAYVYLNNGEYKESIRYAKKSINILYALNNKTYLAYSIITICNNYRNLGEKDSADYYFNKCIPYINNADDFTKGYIYTILCERNINKDIKKAKMFLDKALSAGNVNAEKLSVGGKYHFAIKDYTKAEYLWKKSLKVSNTTFINMASYKGLADICMKRGDIEGYQKYMAAVVAAKDSIYKASKKDNVGRYQAELQGDISKRRTMSTLLYIGIAIVLIAIGAFVFVRYKAGELKRTIKGKESMLEQEKEKSKALEKDLHKTSQRVKTLETSNRQSQKEIKRLNKANEEIELSARRGKQLMEILISGKAKIGQWNNEDYACCIAYCKIEHSQLADEIAAVNPQTSMRNILTAILHEIGYSYDQLGDMFAIKADSIRKNLSRMHKPGKEEPQCEDSDVPTP